MKLRIFRPAIHPSGAKGFEAIRRGCLASGDDCDYTDDIHEDCDVAVHASGIKGGSQRESGLSRARRTLMERFGKRRLILESPAIRPGLTIGQYWRLSLGGFLLDEAEYANEGSPPDRWEMIAAQQGIERHAFRRPKSGWVLVMLQKSSDASLRGKDSVEWAQEMIDQIRAQVNWTIVVRPHPLQRAHRSPRFQGDNVWVSAGKDNDWSEARAVVTYTSLSAIDALLRGLPTWAMDPGNLARPVAMTSLDELAAPSFPSEEVFQQWLWDLGYMQWTVPEIEKGIPWTRLKQKLSALA